MSRKIAVVTGGTKGIGRAIVEKLYGEGYEVITCARSQADLDDLVSALSQGSKVHAFKADLSQNHSVKVFAQQVLSVGGEIDLLVNNTGVFLPGSVLEEHPDNLDTMLRTNLWSAYSLTRLLVPSMLEAGTGHIFNMCSVASLMAYPSGGSYCISKYALLGFTRVLREELKDRGIRVTAIMPGATWSDSWKGIEEPDSRLMQAKDVAEMIWTSYQLSPSAVVEDIIMRPQLGDL